MRIKLNPSFEDLSLLSIRRLNVVTFYVILNVVASLGDKMLVQCEAAFATGDFIVFRIH